MTLNPRFYQNTPTETWKGRIDGTDLSAERWHQRVICFNLLEEELPTIPFFAPLKSEFPNTEKKNIALSTEKSTLAAGSISYQKGIALIGFACHEGVQRNGGRTGAKLGPESFRLASGSLPVHFDSQTLFADLGNITCDSGDLETAQQSLAMVVNYALTKGYQPLVIGGGHEVTYAHYTGITNFLDHKSVLGIINFDAHFDMRQPTSSGPNSGTGFYQIAAECKAKDLPFRYLPIGIQKNSNTRQLFDRAEKLGVRAILSTQIQVNQEQALYQQIDEFIDSCSHIYLTICMDVFSSSVAPGVSAPAYSGLFPDPFFFGILSYILKSGKVISKDIAELNPRYDQDQRTAKLVASLAFHLL